VEVITQPFSITVIEKPLLGPVVGVTTAGAAGVEVVVVPVVEAAVLALEEDEELIIIDRRGKNGTGII